MSVPVLRPQRSRRRQDPMPRKEYSTRQLGQHLSGTNHIESPPQTRFGKRYTPDYPPGYQDNNQFVHCSHRQTRITNDPRSPAPPRRAGHLQSILRVCHSRACHFQAMRGHPTGCRRDLPGRVLRAARPPVAIQSVRNSRETYLRGSSSSARAIPLAISF